jgi:hypothetical protein
MHAYLINKVVFAHMYETADCSNFESHCSHVYCGIPKHCWGVEMSALERLWQLGDVAAHHHLGPLEHCIIHMAGHLEAVAATMTSAPWKLTMLETS